MAQSRYEFLSIEEVANQLQRKRWFIYKLLDQKRLSYHLIGGRRMVSQRDLDTYVARSRCPAIGEKKIKFQEAGV